MAGFNRKYPNQWGGQTAEPKKNEEQLMQSRCAIWYNNKFIRERQRLFMVNNNSHNYIEGNTNKAMGVKAGISDMIFLAPGGMVFFIEFKTLGGKQDAEQEKFEQLVIDDGHQYLIIRSEGQFKKLIHGILGGDGVEVVG